MPRTAGPIRLAELARVLGLEVEGDARLEIGGFASLQKAGPDELVFVSGVAPGWYRAPVSAREFLAWQAQADAFEDMAAYRPVMRYISGNGEPQRIHCSAPKTM